MTSWEVVLAVMVGLGIYNMVSGVVAAIVVVLEYKYNNKRKPWYMR